MNYHHFNLSYCVEIIRNDNKIDIFLWFDSEVCVVSENLSSQSMLQYCSLLQISKQSCVTLTELFAMLETFYLQPSIIALFVLQMSRALQTTFSPLCTLHPAPPSSTHLYWSRKNPSLDYIFLVIS